MKEQFTKGEWVSVKNKLPEENEKYENSYLVRCDYGACIECDVAYFDEDNFWRDEKYDKKIPVTHWMKLPAQPED